MQARGGGANLPTAMVQFCAIISAPFHLPHTLTVLACGSSPEKAVPKIAN